MKRRSRKTRKLETRKLETRKLETRKHMKKYQKGGYTYNKNDKLDKASSNVSNSSSGSNSNIHRKSRRRLGSRTKRRSRK
jgi:hypothetical protein